MNRTDKIILAILFCAMIIGGYFIIDPSGKESTYRNAERVLEVELLLDAIHRNYVANDRKMRGALAGIDEDKNTVQMISRGVPEEYNCVAAVCAEVEVAGTNCYANLAGLTASAIDEIPFDPQQESETLTGYYVNKIGTTFVVGACTTEDERERVAPAIELSR